MGDHLDSINIMGTWIYLLVIREYYKDSFKETFKWKMSAPKNQEPLHPKLDS
jgi:hypothetical protein